jgi:glycosyltransferase involved in cell wall biosynthesis
MNDTVLIMPAHNEERMIRKVVTSILACELPLDVVVVDDGSRDDTAREAQQAGAMVVRLPVNLGYGAALQTGYKYALLKGYRYLAQMDSDGQHEPTSLQSLLRPIYSGQADLVLGSRFLDRCAYRVPLARRMGMLLFGALAQLTTGQRVTDPTSGFQAMNREIVQLYTTDVYPGDYPDADMIILLHRMGFRITEVPVKMYASQGASMHDGLKPFFYVYKMLVSILMVLVRRLPYRQPRLAAKGSEVVV